MILLRSLGYFGMLDDQRRCDGGAVRAATARTQPDLPGARNSGDPRRRRRYVRDGGTEPHSIGLGRLDPLRLGYPDPQPDDTCPDPLPVRPN